MGKGRKKGRSSIGMWVMDIGVFLFILLGAISAFAAGANVADKPWYTGFAPIAILLAVIAIFIWRLPKVKEEFPGQLPHLEDAKYRFRRALNWVIAGTMYAFLYWGRYNINEAIRALGVDDPLAFFNMVFSIGTTTYGISFLINGPLTDRLGGRFSILVGVIGASVMNIAMGIACWIKLTGQISADSLFWTLLVLYPLNMYFQSFGAVAIVKLNSAWFHVRERGVFGAIFGILIALGLYFAFDWTNTILHTWTLPVHWAFFFPATALAIMFIIGLFVVRNRPSEAGLADILTGDATSGETGKSDNPVRVFKLMFQNKVIMIIACIEFCSGFLRQAIMQIYRPFAKAIGANASFVYENWGLLLCCAGIMGGMFAGVISDRLCHSKRGPVAAILYVGMFLGSIGMCFLLGEPMLAWLMVFMSLCIIGVHGMLSGTASQDFGGARNAGIATGIIDGFVYAGTGLQALLYYFTLPDVKNVDAAKDPANWWVWPVAMVPWAIIGLILSYRIRHEKPADKPQFIHKVKKQYLAKQNQLHKPEDFKVLHIWELATGVMVVVTKVTGYKSSQAAEADQISRAAMNDNRVPPFDKVDIFFDCKVWDIDNADAGAGVEAMFKDYPENLAPLPYWPEQSTEVTDIACFAKNALKALGNTTWHDEPKAISF